MYLSINMNFLQKLKSNLYVIIFLKGECFMLLKPQRAQTRLMVLTRNFFLLSLL